MTDTVLLGAVAYDPEVVGWMLGFSVDESAALSSLHTRNFM